jgi:uncharacterized protein
LYCGVYCSVQDADKLDAIGAFGVLRCAAFSGARNIALFNPADAPIEGMTKEQYEQQTESGGGSSINHFHGKYDDQQTSRRQHVNSNI